MRGGPLIRQLIAIGFGFGLLVAPVAAADVPRPAPEFPIQLVGGKQLLLSQYRGKVVAVEFLQTTCPHCQNCSAILNRMYKEYGPRGFQALGVAFNDMAIMLVPDYISQLQLTFPVGVGARDPVISFLQHPVMEILYVPQLVFIDRNGVIRAQYQGRDNFFNNEEVNMRAQIESLLKEPVARPKASKPKPAPKSTSLSRPQALN
jgi:peroxiredoxin